MEIALGIFVLFGFATVTLILMWKVGEIDDRVKELEKKGKVK